MSQTPPQERLELTLWPYVKGFLLGKQVSQLPLVHPRGQCTRPNCGQYHIRSVLGFDTLPPAALDTLAPVVECPICFDELDIIGLPPKQPDAPDGTPAHRETAVLYPCGHMTCVGCCYSGVEGMVGLGFIMGCPLCRFDLRFAGCGCEAKLQVLPTFDDSQSKAKIAREASRITDTFLGGGDLFLGKCGLAGLTTDPKDRVSIGSCPEDQLLADLRRGLMKECGWALIKECSWESIDMVRTYPDFQSEEDFLLWLRDFHAWTARRERATVDRTLKAANRLAVSICG
ncbi:hypothetical protein B0H67DRAFT_642700 [Lasiosphaeris hirsuta]|uniref:RING-type domain-containing protein n=1 Tax=Lasiosphaeris hirsuta TaxID=260670 RepID=A0AA40AP50_9PEZI|nr:hypothetical protein B0H67DRAFT_642700 [Lasiosphaeris hirsuta]